MQINEAIEDDTSKSLAGLTSRRFLLYSHASRFPSQTITGLELSAIAEPAKGEVFFLHYPFLDVLLWNEILCAVARF